MADVFDKTLFGGARFGDLGEFAVGSRPIWLANATDAARWTRFTFSDEQQRQINSSLATLPVSQAVMASAVLSTCRRHMREKPTASNEDTVKQVGLFRSRVEDLRVHATV
jgi:hypothetical protein